jgi:DNA-binding NarL/FixJ family response regulator
MDALVRRATVADTVADVFAAASGMLRRLVPHDAAAWLLTDPATGLPTAPALIDGVSATAEQCSAHWRHEFVDQDVNLFRHLAHAGTPAAALRLSIPDPHRSARYRRFLRPQEFIDELRAVLRVGDTPWGTVTLWRRTGGQPFSRAETGVLASLSTPLGCVLRDRARAHSAAAPTTDRQSRPGLLLFDARGQLASADEQAADWLDELPADDGMATHLGLRVPIWLLLTVVRARDSLAEGGDGTVTSRVRSRDGRWIVCHASTTSTARGEAAHTAVVLEWANPARIAAILVEAYGLTPREQEITRLIARGLGTKAIAGTLHLSPFTVKDHVKAILGKVGVANRGELVATLFADLYEPDYLSGVVAHGERQG